jgi:hypothetical protein
MYRINPDQLVKKHHEHAFKSRYYLTFFNTKEKSPKSAKGREINRLDAALPGVTFTHHSGRHDGRTLIYRSLLRSW